MTIARIEKEYLELLEKGNIPEDERLSISKGILVDGTPTPPRVLARLFLDKTIAVKEEAKKSILRLQENELSKIASDDATHSSLLLLLAKHFHDSPAVGISIISNKNTTEKILFYLQGRGDEIDDGSDEGGDIQGETEDDIEISDEVEIEISDEVEIEIGEETDIEIGEEIEIEISENEGIGLEDPSEEDIDGETSSGETPDLTANPKAGEEEVFEFVPESYKDGDMEVIIEVDETDDFDEEEEIVISDEGAAATEEVIQDVPQRDEIIEDDEIKSGDIDIGITYHDEGEQLIGDDIASGQGAHLDEKGTGFATTIDSIEDKVGEIFDIDLSDTDDIQGDKASGVSEGGIEFEANSDIPGMETPVEGDTPFKSQEPFSGFGGGADEQFMETGRDKVDISLSAPSSKRFVTHLATKKGNQKALVAELFAKVAKIAVPVAIVVLAFSTFWVFFPKEEVIVEKFDSGVNRVLVKAKKKGLYSKLKNPFPKGSSIYKWELDEVQEERGFDPDGEAFGDKKLKEDLLGFKAKYERELEYEKVSEELSENKMELLSVSKQIKKIDEELSFLIAEKDSYLEKYEGDSLKKRIAVDERDKEIGEFKGQFEKDKLMIEEIEEEIADTKERIASFERDNVPTADDHGYYANKRELENLTREYRKIKPKFDNFSSRYNSILNKLENKYKEKLNIIDRIEVISQAVIELNRKKAKIEKRKRVLKGKIEKLEKRTSKLEKANATGENITDENLPVFLLMSKYIREQEKLQADSELNEKDEISYFETYTIKQRNADIIITTENKEGEKEKKKYSTTFMRMITKKKILMFEWDIKTTEWVLISITKKKK